MAPQRGRHSAGDGGTDKARVDYLAGDPDVELDAPDQAELDELRALLADPSLWAEPPAELEESVVTLIAAEASETAAGAEQDIADPLLPAPAELADGAPATVSTASPMSSPPAPADSRQQPLIAGVNDDGTPIDLAAARERRSTRDQTAAFMRRRWTRPGILLAAAAAVVAVTLSAVLILRDSTPQPRFDVALSATELAPGASGSATMLKTNSGWKITLDATGLPRRDGGQFYEAWLRNAGNVLVPIGSFNEGTDVTLWAGVSPQDFPTFTVTKESADGNQDSSGQRVLVGTAAEATDQ